MLSLGDCESSTIDHMPGAGNSTSPTVRKLDPDSENVDAVRRFGYKAYFGDPSRLELLRAVGAGEAKVLVAALPDVAENLKLVETVRRNFPDLKIYARARPAA